MTSERLQPDFYTFVNWPEMFAKRLIVESTGYQKM